MKKLITACIVGGLLALGAPLTANAEEAPSSPDSTLTTQEQTSQSTLPEPPSASAPDLTDTTAEPTSTGSSATAEDATPPASSSPTETSSETTTEPSDSSAPSTSPAAPPSSTLPAASSPVLPDGPRYRIVALKINSGDTAQPWAIVAGFDHAQNVTNDAITDSDSLDQLDAYLACGAAYQVDLHHNSAIAATLVAGGYLDGPNNPQEDLATETNGGTPWKYITTEACPPTPGPANPAATIETQCGLANVIVTNLGENILTASVVIYLDGNFLTALALQAGETVATPVGFGEDTGDHVLSVRTGPAFGDVELARAENINSDCEKPPVVTPPTTTPSPTPSPTPTVSTTQIEQASATVPVGTEKLASTGSNVTDRWTIIGIIGGIIVVLGIIFVAFHELRVPKKRG